MQSLVSSSPAFGKTFNFTSSSRARCCGTPAALLLLLVVVLCGSVVAPSSQRLSHHQGYLFPAASYARAEVSEPFGLDYVDAESVAALSNVQAVYIMNTSFIQNETAYGPLALRYNEGLVSFWAGICKGYSGLDYLNVSTNNDNNDAYTVANVHLWCSAGDGVVLQMPTFWSTTAPPGVYNYSLWSSMMVLSLFFHCSSIQNCPGDNAEFLEQDGYPGPLTFYPGEALFPFTQPWSVEYFATVDSSEGRKERKYRTDQLAAMKSGLPYNFFSSGFVGGLFAGAPCAGARFNTFALLLYQSPPVLVQMQNFPVKPMAQLALYNSHIRQCGQTAGCQSRNVQCLMKLVLPEYTGNFYAGQEDWVRDGGLFFEMYVQLCNRSLSDTVSVATGQLIRQGFSGVIATSPRHYNKLYLPSELIQAVLSWVSASRGNWIESLWVSEMCWTEADAANTTYGEVTVCNISSQIAGILPTLRIHLGSQQLLTVDYYEAENSDDDDNPSFSRMLDSPSDCILSIDLNVLVNPNTFQLTLYSTGSLNQFVNGKKGWPNEPILIIGAGLLKGATLVTSRTTQTLGGVGMDYLSNNSLFGLPVLFISVPYPYLQNSEIAESTSLTCLAPITCSSKQTYIQSINKCAETWCIGSITVHYYPDTLKCKLSVEWIVITGVVTAVLGVAEVVLTIIQGLVRREVLQRAKHLDGVRSAFPVRPKRR